MPTGIPDPSYYPAALDFIVGVLPSPTFTDLGAGLAQVSFLKSKIQAGLWNYLVVNKHYVVNVSKVSAGLIKQKSSDATKYILQAQHDVGDIWAANDQMALQTHQFFMHMSNAKLASRLARNRDFILGWRDDGTWGVIKQAADYDPHDADTLHVNPGDDLSAQDNFDIQVIQATGQVLNMCRSSDPVKKSMDGLSDNVLPLRINRNTLMTIQAALDMLEDARAKQGGV